MSKRAEYRRQQREAEKKYTFTKEQLAEYVKTEIREVTEAVLKDASVMISELFMMYCYHALNEVYGFGKERLRKFKEEVDHLAEGVTKGAITNEELIIHCHEHFGVDMSPVFEKFNINMDTFDKNKSK